MIIILKAWRISSQITALSVLIGFGLVSCLGPRLAQRPPDQPETQSQGAERYEEIWQRNQLVDTLRAEAQLQVSRGLFSRAAQQYIVVKRPDQLRIDSYDTVGQLVMQVVYTDDRLYFSEPPTGYFRSEQDATLLLKEELGLDIPIDHLILLLSGGIPLEAKENYLAVTRTDDVLLRGLWTQLELDEQTGLPKRFAERLPGGQVYEVQFDRYEMIDGVWFPIHVEMAVSNPSVGMAIDYLGVELNQPFEEGLFAPPVLPVDVELGE